MITESRRITEHFHSTEFKCKHCGVIKIEEELVHKLENIFAKLNASKCIISSGYRCPTHDYNVGKIIGRHSEGLASDCIYYDKNGNIIPSLIVICVAYDLGELNGIAKINNNYTHLDNRKNGTYRGDEPRGNSSYWSNPYTYFGISKSDVTKYTGEEISKKSIDEIAELVIKGYFGNYPERKSKLEAEGYNYSEVQNRVNELVRKDVYLSNANYNGNSIVDALKQINIDSSYLYRSKLASVNGISNYRGSAEQNLLLLDKLRKGQLKKV